MDEGRKLLARLREDVDRLLDHVEKFLDRDSGGSRKTAVNYKKLPAVKSPRKSWNMVFDKDEIRDVIAEFGSQPFMRDDLEKVLRAKGIIKPRTHINGTTLWNHVKWAIDDGSVEVLRKASGSRPGVYRYLGKASKKRSTPRKPIKATPKRPARVAKPHAYSNPHERPVMTAETKEKLSRVPIYPVVKTILGEFAPGREFTTNEVVTLVENQIGRSLSRSENSTVYATISVLRNRNVITEKGRTENNTRIYTTGGGES